MTEYATIENITKMFLYGSLETPQYIPDRLRNSSSSTPSEVTVSVNEYMLGVGRYAKASSAPVVELFFEDGISRALGETDSYGVTRLSLANYRSSQTGVWNGDDIVVSHYTTDVGSDDYPTRAYIWGTNPYEISPDAVFVWDTDGTKHIENTAVIPKADNFDLLSSNAIFQMVNETVLTGLIDPYGIGRTVNLVFDQTQVQNWATTTEKDYYQEDFEADQLSVLGNLSAWNPLGAYLGILSAADEIYSVAYEAYVDDEGRNIIYGTSDADTLDSSSLAWQPSAVWNPLFDPDPEAPAVYVGGDGDDVIAAGNDDYVYGGSGSDTITAEQATFVDAQGGDDNIVVIGGEVYGGDGHDVIISTDAFVSGDDGDDEIIDLRGYVYGGNGNDTIQSNEGEVFGDDGDDVITGSSIYVESGAGSDTITVNSGGTIITGEGNDNVYLNGSGGDFLIEYYSGDGHDIINNNLVDESGNIELVSYSDYLNFDVYLYTDSAEMTYSDGDTSRWNIEFYVKVNFDNGSVLVNNLHGSLYSSTPNIATYSFGSLESSELLFNSSQLSIYQSDANIFLM